MPDSTSLLLFAFLAGFIDAIAGGGGLIQLPALFIFRPDLPITSVLATNKLASIAGTGVAMVQFARKVPMKAAVLLPASIAAFAFSSVGAWAVSFANPELMKPVILVLLISVAVYTVFRKDFGEVHAPRLDSRKELAASIVTGAVIGFYDGFFGPGTGSFLIFSFIGIFGFDFLRAAASAKVVNFMTNLSAILYFAAAGHINYPLAVVMGAFNILGSLLGSRLAILKGSRFVRVLFIAVVTMMIGRMGFDILRTSP
jgi:uncharacterized protein